MPTLSSDCPTFQVALWLEPANVELLAWPDTPYGPFAVHRCDGAAQLLAQVDAGCDVLILDDRSGRASEIVPQSLGDAALVVVLAELEPARVLAWWQRGAQEVLRSQDLGDVALPMRLRAAIERKHIERDARTAYATDLDTGLPHQQQLIEHMSQLLALREREPAPMAVLALRIEGLATTQVRLGRQASNVLRRKLGVRLRAGVRASDVVASIGDDVFAVLLGSILAPADAPRVAAKLQKSLMAPFHVAGQDVVVASAIGIGQYPQDGTQPDALLRRAVGLAAAAQALGRSGASSVADGAGAMTGAANDE